MNVRLFKPSVGRDEMQAIQDVFDRAWLGLGPKVTEFESRWIQYIGCTSAIAVNSCTAALHLALSAFRFPRGKKVLVPAMTFAASATAILYNDLEPVFVDINPRTLGMSLSDLERKWTKDCVAIVAVHMGGHPLPMEDILAFAHANHLKVVEDCAHATGGEYAGKKLGTFGDIGCFSFEEKKGMTTGDGGMISSNDEELIAPLRATRWLGIDKDTWKRNPKYTQSDRNNRHWYYSIARLGYKYNMNDIAAAIGLVQLQKLDHFNARKRAIIRRYLKGLQGVPEIRPLLPYALDTNAAYWIFGLRTPQRDHLIHHLMSKQIATSVHYTPLPLHPIFEPYTSDIPHSLAAYDEMITLPLHVDLSDSEIDYVVEAIRAFASG